MLILFHARPYCQWNSYRNYTHLIFSKSKRDTCHPASSFEQSLFPSLCRSLNIELAIVAPSFFASPPQWGGDIKHRWGQMPSPLEKVSRLWRVGRGRRPRSPGPPPRHCEETPQGSTWQSGFLLPCPLFGAQPPGEPDCHVVLAFGSASSQ